jgi:hypothetical protein
MHSQVHTPGVILNMTSLYSICGTLSIQNIQNISAIVFIIPSSVNESVGERLALTSESHLTGLVVIICKFRLRTDCLQHSAQR